VKYKTDFGCKSLHRNCQQNIKSVLLTVAYSYHFSERELAFTFAICYRRFVCLSSVCL